jgi:hypothetical protein
MSAGHPNDASPDNLYNTPIALHVGGNDTAYDRNLKVPEWGQRLDAWAKTAPGAYRCQWQVHAGLGHWMNLQDKVSIPFVQQQVRNPYPRQVVWNQSGTPVARMYWLHQDPETRKAQAKVVASYEGQEIRLRQTVGLTKLTIRVSDAMVNLDKPVRILVGEREAFLGVIPRTLRTLARTLEERGDPAMVYMGEQDVPLP